MKQMAKWGNEYKEEKAFRDLLASLLESGSAYEGHLALTGASVTRDARATWLALSHGKAGVRGRAARLLPEIVPDGNFLIETEIESMSHECRRQLLRSVVSVSRQDWAERLLPLVLARWGGHEAAELLSACGEETVRKRLPELGYAISNWKTITTRYPDIVAEYAQAALKQATPREKLHVWWRFTTAIEVLCVLRPSTVLEYALQYGPAGMLHPVLKRNLGLLMKTNAESVFELLTREDARGDLLTHGMPPAVLKKRKLFSIEQWAKLTTMLAEKPLHVAKVLDALAPSWRGFIFDAVYKEEECRMRIFPTPLLDVLPHSWRDREATRMLDLREIKESRDRTLEITSRQLIAHAREKLEKGALVSGADERAAAYAHLIRSTSLSRSGMDDTLRFLTRIKNDQDPVRNAVMVGLCNCPASMFEEEHLQALTLLVESVIEARDTSYGTRAATENLAFTLLRHHAQEPESLLFRFSLRTMGKMAIRDGQFMLRSMDWSSLPDSALNIVVDEFYALGVEANKRESHHYVLRMAGAFGKAAERLPKLQLLLKELLHVESVSSQAAHYWLAPYKTRDERVRELLDGDPSFISLHKVFIHLHLKRQEWLDPFISGSVIKGKHLSGKTIYLVPASDGFYRWLPRQQKALAVLLEKVALDAKRNYSERSAAMRALASLPDFNSDKLKKLQKDGEVQIAEAALHACSLWEEPEKALPLLLDHLEGDRARVAMYSIPRCVRRMKPSEMTSVLSELLNRDKLKVTVRKEAIRLLGAFKNKESMTLLLREFEKPNIHKDVVIAIGHAARQWLDDERSWTMLSALALSPERDVVKSLLYQNPGELPPRNRPRYVQWMVDIAGRADAEVAQEAFRAMKLWADGNEALLAAAAGKAILDMENSSRWKAALETLIVVCQEGTVNDSLIGLCAQLADMEAWAEWNAAAERDLPHRQRLLTLIDKLVSLPRHDRLRLFSLYEGIIAELADKKAMEPSVIKLHLAKVDWSRVDGTAAHLEHVIRITMAKPYLLDYAAKRVAQTVHADRGNWTPEALLGTVDHLNGQTPFEAQYIGLSLLQVAGRTLLWNQASTDRLRTYRKHGHESIRLMALDMWTISE